MLFDTRISQWMLLLVLFVMCDSLLFYFPENLNNPLAASIRPDWWPRSMCGSDWLSSGKRFKSTNLQAGSFLLIAVGDCLAQLALNLSWLIYGPAFPGYISNTGPGSKMQPLTAARRSSTRTAEATTETRPAMSGQQSLALIRVESREMSPHRDCGKWRE